MADEFKPGDLVRLKSGGPVMTVDEVGEDNSKKPTVYCVWQEGSKKFTNDYPPHTLQLWGPQGPILV
jgi:uncharacterized protein YodC (DUF2158 family)